MRWSNCSAQIHCLINDFTCIMSCPSVVLRFACVDLVADYDLGTKNVQKPSLISQKLLKLFL